MELFGGKWFAQNLAGRLFPSPSLLRFPLKNLPEASTGSQEPPEISWRLIYNAGGLVVVPLV